MKFRAPLAALAAAQQACWSPLFCLCERMLACQRYNCKPAKKIMSQTTVSSWSHWRVFCTNFMMRQV